MHINKIIRMKIRIRTSSTVNFRECLSDNLSVRNLQPPHCWGTANYLHSQKSALSQASVPAVRTSRPLPETPWSEEQVLQAAVRAEGEHGVVVRARVRGALAVFGSVQVELELVAVR